MTVDKPWNFDPLSFRLTRCTADASALVLTIVAASDIWFEKTSLDVKLFHARLIGDTKATTIVLQSRSDTTDNRIDHRLRSFFSNKTCDE